MAFESIDITKLENSLNTCKELLSTSKINEVKDNISSDAVWQNSAKTNLINALSNLSGVKYDNLSKKIDDYLEIVQYIKEYKELANTVSTGETQYNNMKSSLDSKKDKVTSSEKSKLNDLQNNINTNKQRMAELEEKVSNSI